METNPKYFGNKTLRLQECRDLGLPVPQFFALPSTISKQLFEDDLFRQKTAQDILTKVPAKSYAVRSSALVEDSSLSSFAGQFETRLNVAPADLSDAILKVLTQASEYLRADLESFSLLIQEYIDPDYAGVVFTRSPMGTREMIVEYAAGSGEQVVGGRIQAKKVAFYTTENIPASLLNLGITEKQRTQFYNLEKIYQSPQDIEWCIYQKQFYFLQTRPITTITAAQYEQITFLENSLPQKQNFYFAKTEITEIAPRPTENTFKLLDKIYAANGPVEQVYKKHKIHYTNTKFLLQIAGELFVDKEKELQSLLPSYTYFDTPNYSPKMHFTSQLFSSIKNIFQLNTIKFPNSETLFNTLKNIFEDKVKANFEEGLHNFLHNYETIFEINLLCGLALKKLEFIIKKEKISCLEILNADELFLEDSHKYTIALDEVHWKGNSLAFDDESDFVYTKNTNTQNNQNIELWWGALPAWKRQQLKPIITNCILYNRFREYGRWAVVKQINELRNLLPKSTQNNTKKQTSSASLPNSLTQKYIDTKTTLLGVSLGEAIGILVTCEDLDNNLFPQKHKILYTPILSPDLTKYFDRIQGVVSEQGGLLSHLAIVARESHIPVIVNFNLSNTINFGDHIFMNAYTNSVTKIIAKKP